MHITFVAESIENNSIGRTYCLWLLARKLGWDTTTLATRGASLWGPVRDSAFARTVRRIDPRDLETAVPVKTSLVIACKPYPESLGNAIEIARSRGLGLIVDVDDPDLEARLRVGSPVMAAARWIRHPGRSIADRTNARWTRELPSFTSNPWLLERWGGVLIPHAREDQGNGTYSDSSTPRVVFVGTSRAHKGISLLRDAVGALRSSGFTLTITDDAPDDARPGEHWVGRTTLADGLQLVRDADIVALPSAPDRFSVGQLPAKLVDAMLFGRAVAVSRVAPMPWAVDDAGLVFEPDSLPGLISALEQLRDPARRRDLGKRARARALEEFSVEALLPRFRAECERVASDGWREPAW
ncbi:MAG: glycosyltransferase [Microbacterium sp.]